MLFLKEDKKKEVIEEEVVLSEEDKSNYKAWFKQQMKKVTGKDKITDMSSEEKKKFFDHIDSNWEAKEETD